VVQDIEELIELDATLTHRGALVTLPHPKLGDFGHVRTPLSFSVDRQTPYRAPGLGEHSFEVASSVAGLSAERVAGLDAAGVLK
jgi:crotonobetainyl-CoA:carnitine CoA-transferase CaiB-like acyl-CoA transferase